MAKNKVENKILFIDASNEFLKEINNNILSDENIGKILDEFDKRADIKYFSSYVEKEDLREKIDIKKLNLEIENVVENITNLRKEISQIVKEIENTAIIVFSRLKNTTKIQKISVKFAVLETF